MDSRSSQVIPLAGAFRLSVADVGAKARNLSLCLQEGFTVPDGFVVTTEGYRQFAARNRLPQIIDMELLRKPFEDMRWEEVWDIALRIRSAFLKGSMPGGLEEAVRRELLRWPSGTRFAIRSSSPAEDGSQSSYAGIHESYLDVSQQEVLRHLCLVWASLWSDRSLLYRKELKLEPDRSAMAVLVQPEIREPVSGLTFTADPATGKTDEVLVEVVEGTLDRLVDNVVEPQRYRLDRVSGKMVTGGPGSNGLLAENDRMVLWQKALALEGLLGVPADIEWTGTGERFTVLQVRPVTGIGKETDPERDWYLSLTPGRRKLLELTDRVEHQLIPALKDEVRRFEREAGPPWSREELAGRLKTLGEGYRKWKKIYWDEFIPFAHGIRNFGTYYNDLMGPEDPYEFMYLLRSDDLLARSRDRQMEGLAGMLREDPALRELLEEWSRQEEPVDGSSWPDQARKLRIPEEFLGSLGEFIATQLNLYYDNTGLADDLRMLFGILVSMAGKPGPSSSGVVGQDQDAEALERLYLEAAGPAGRQEAAGWLRIGRLSWKLRDDDNILLGRLEHQLMQTMREAMKDLHRENRLESIPERIVLEDWEILLASLQGEGPVMLSKPPEIPSGKDRGTLQVRQLVGQPSSPGTATGRARVLRSLDEFRKVVAGEVLVFDAIQPQMTFVISLAGAIVERRGGMLVHSSIIARELGIPAVNGVSRATELIRTGDLVTVNGDLGLVIVGEPEFELERKAGSQ